MALQGMFSNLINNNKLGGINCLIWKDGQVLMMETFGYKNLQTLEPMTSDALFRISSMTKPITSVIALMLYEAGKLDLDEPITNWFPSIQEHESPWGPQIA